MTREQLMLLARTLLRLKWLNQYNLNGISEEEVDLCLRTIYETMGSEDIVTVVMEVHDECETRRDY